MPRETYTEEGWKALERAARAYKSAHATGDTDMISLARDVFNLTLRRVNRDCVIPLAPTQESYPRHEPP